MTPRLRRPDPEIATRRDRVSSSGVAVLFSLSLGTASVALPLLAIASGYSASEVGILAALSAAAQMLSRLGMGAWMRRLPDWSFVFAAGALLALSCALPLASTAWAPFALAHLLQGAARAFYWTGSQTHVVRGGRGAMKELASINLLSSGGLTVGPFVAGAVGSYSLPLTLALAAVVSLGASIPAALLDRLPVFVRPTSPSTSRMWRRPGVDAGCWAGVSAGAWRALLNSYVPLVLVQADQSTSTIGVVVGIANFAQIVGSGLAGWIDRRRVAVTFAASMLGAGLGTAAVGAVASHAGAVGLALALSGLGAGALQTMGPALASEAVDPQERGQAIAAAGVFRAGALLVAPLGASALVLVAPLWSTLALGGVIIVAPAHLARRLRASPT